MTTYYKVLGPNRKPIHGGSGRWPEPGEWTVKIDDVIPCRRGYHLVTLKQLAAWIPRRPCSVWTVEPGEVLIHADDKLVTNTARLGWETPFVQVRADYDRIVDAVEADYNRILKAAWADYDRTVDAARADYDRILKGAWADCNRILDAAEADHDRIVETALRAIVTAKRPETARRRLAKIEAMMKEEG